MKQKTKPYDHKKIEPKWRKIWEKKGIYKADSSSKKQKKYVLDMFPYPSGAGLHVGHPRGYIASDVYARLMRAKGFNVLHPMGFDSFGLPAEQYAIKTGNNPKGFTDKLVKQYKKQLDIIGFSYDWDRMVATHKPEYYRWTQWIFLKLYGSWYNKESNKAELIDTLVKFFEKSGNGKVNAVCDSDVQNFSADEWLAMGEVEQQKILMKYRLAYEGFSEVNWCPELGTVLANDEIVDGPDGKPVSERGGFPVEKKSLRQWFLRITAYADRLISGLETLDWSGHIKEIQKNWIGKSVGSEIEFELKGQNEKIKVFTTRADTLFGVTYVVLAPEHSLVKKLLSSVSNKPEVEKYIADVKNKTDEDRTATNKEKTGVELKGVSAINPANGEEVPVWIADYVLASYGTGAVMAVPAHDERDFEFANKYKLAIKDVIAPRRIDYKNPHVSGKQISFRRGVIVIVRNPKTDEYLTLKWKSLPWTTFVTGGIDGDESAEEASIRELKEETGYSNIKIIKKVVGPVQSEFFAKHKGVNRVAHTWTILCELTPETKQENISVEEKEKHEILWVSKRDLKTLEFNHAEIDLIFQGFEKNIVVVEDGVLVASGDFDGLSSEEARTKITEAVCGKIVTKYKMRDAVFARQRYWGEPIPLIHEKDGTIKPLKEKDLPLELPNVKSYAPTGNAESPLSAVKTWTSKGYETNTMPGWAGSSWYFLRYTDPKNKKEFASEKALKYWNQVDMYVGGAEHATGHLLYSRFWNKFLFDLGLVPSDEPFKTMRNQGMILGADNRKMSKRWGNVVNPDDVVKTFGADTLRVFEMFIGPFDSQLPWSIDGIVGSRRFVERVWKLQNKVSIKFEGKKSYEQTLHKTIKKVGEDIEGFNFNTAISAMMICLNEMESVEFIDKKDFEKFVQILAPFAPHIGEELWVTLGNKGSVNTAPWPEYDPKKLESDTVKIMIQINGKVRSEIEVPRDIDEKACIEAVKSDKATKKWIDGKEVMKTIYVPGRIVNLVVKG